jgi:putative acetyltransferase
MRVSPTDPASEASVLLIAQSDSYLKSLYPPESQHLESVAALQLPNVMFFGGYFGNEMVACGAVKVLQDNICYGEIKRVFVVEQWRRRGLSRQIMGGIEQYLKEISVSLARLETGIKQPEALALYASLGYEVREPFGKYSHDPLSVFMEKVIY